MADLDKIYGVNTDFIGERFYIEIVLFAVAAELFAGVDEQRCGRFDGFCCFAA